MFLRFLLNWESDRHALTFHRNAGLIMRRILSVLLISSLIACAPVRGSRAPAPPAAAAVASQKQPPASQKPSETLPQLGNVAEEKLAEPNVRNGVIFAKTDFQGVLEK